MDFDWLAGISELLDRLRIKHPSRIDDLVAVEQLIKQARVYELQFGVTSSDFFAEIGKYKGKPEYRDWEDILYRLDAETETLLFELDGETENKAPDVSDKSRVRPIDIDKKSINEKIDAHADQLICLVADGLLNFYNDIGRLSDSIVAASMAEINPNVSIPYDIFSWPFIQLTLEDLSLDPQQDEDFGTESVLADCEQVLALAIGRVLRSRYNEVIERRLAWEASHCELSSFEYFRELIVSLKALEFHFYTKDRDGVGYDVMSETVVTDAVHSSYKCKDLIIEEAMQLQSFNNLWEALQKSKIPAYSFSNRNDYLIANNGAYSFIGPKASKIRSSTSGRDVFDLFADLATDYGLNVARGSHEHYAADVITFNFSWYRKLPERLYTLD